MFFFIKCDLMFVSAGTVTYKLITMTGEENVANASPSPPHSKNLFIK